MRIKPFILVLFSLLVALVGCETTGDPTTGGYWGYSPQKNEARRAAMRSELGGLEDQQRALKSERSRLQSDLSRKKRDLASLQRRRREINQQSVINPSQSDAIDREIAALQSDVSVLEARLVDLNTL